MLQSLIGLIAAIYLAFSVSAPSNTQFFQLFNAWLASGFNLDLPPKADLIVPFFKTVSYPLGVWGFIVLSYCVIVGSEQCRQSHRRPRRARHHADGDGRRGAGSVRVCDGSRRLLELPVPAAHSRRRAS